MVFRFALLLALFGLLSGAPSWADEAVKLEYAIENNIAYYDAATLARADEYQKEQTKLDIYYPKGAKGFATVVWFHGGGLTGGSRYFPALKEQGSRSSP